MSAHPSPAIALPDEPRSAPPSRVLVLNSGSSSVKYQLLDMSDSSRLASGLVERIGERTSLVRHTPSASGEPRSGPDRSRTTRPP